MLSDNIKKYRKVKRISQENLAIQLHVVRQTISKWENSLSVPDADQLISLAQILNVGVDDLLGVEMENPEDSKDIAAQLVKANERIAQYAEEKRIQKRVGQVRGLILWLTIIAVIIMQISATEVVAISICLILLIVALIILYRNVSLLSIGYHDAGNEGSIKIVTVMDIVLLSLIVLFVILVETGMIHMRANQGKTIVAALVSSVIIFSGIIAPKLPYNRHTGLRLPWTVQNKEAWNIAHKVLGITSIPLGLIYISLSLHISDIEILTLIVIAAWIGIPGFISLIYVYIQSPKQKK